MKLRAVVGIAGCILAMFCPGCTLASSAKTPAGDTKKEAAKVKDDEMEKSYRLAKAGEYFFTNAGVGDLRMIGAGQTCSGKPTGRMPRGIVPRAGPDARKAELRSG